MSFAKVIKDNECLYLTQDLSGLGTYDRAKAIIQFCDKETKLFEKEIDKAILEIFERNGINVPNTDKSVLKLAFDLLKAKGKDIRVENNTENLYNCEKIKVCKLFSVYLEDDKYLQVAIRVKEIDL